MGLPKKRKIFRKNKSYFFFTIHTKNIFKHFHLFCLNSLLHVLVQYINLKIYMYIHTCWEWCSTVWSVDWFAQASILHAIAYIPRTNLCNPKKILTILYSSFYNLFLIFSPTGISFGEWYDGKKFSPVIPTTFS